MPGGNGDRRDRGRRRPPLRNDGIHVRTHGGTAATLAVAVAVLAIASGAGGVTASERSSARDGRWWLGRSFAGLELTHSEGGHYVYGDCDPGGEEGGCSPPLQIVNHSTCERNPVAIDIPPRRVFRLRDAGIATDYRDATIDVGTGHKTVVVFAHSGRLALRAARQLRRRSESAPSTRLSAPRYPRAVMEELKRVWVAYSRYRTVNAVARTTGLSPEVVRVRLDVARLLGSRALRHVRVPHRSWQAVQRDRQADFWAQEFGARDAMREFAVSWSELRRMIQRVRGLTGRC
jgi:hypothetical protein